MGRQADALVFALDTDCDGLVSKDEFVAGFETFHRLRETSSVVDDETDEAELQQEERTDPAAWQRTEKSAAIVLDRGGAGGPSS